MLLHKVTQLSFFFIVLIKRSLSTEVIYCGFKLYIFAGNIEHIFLKELQQLL